MQRSYTVDELHAPHRVDEVRGKADCDHDRYHCRVPGETEAEFEETLGLLDRVQYDNLFSFKYSRRPNTPALALDDQITEEEKARRLAILQEHQRQIQIRNNAAYVDQVFECMVEGFNKATGHGWANFAAQDGKLPAAGLG